MHIRHRNVLPSALLGLLMCFFAASAIAEPPTPSASNPDKIEGSCNENDGIYWPPGPENNTYGCLLPDGTLIICEGHYCETTAAASGLPSGKVPLAAVAVVQGIKTETQLTDLSSKLQQLKVQVDDLAVLVADVCEPEIFQY